MDGGGFIRHFADCRLLKYGCVACSYLVICCEDCALYITHVLSQELWATLSWLILRQFSFIAKRDSIQDIYRQGVLLYFLIRAKTINIFKLCKVYSRKRFIK